MNQGRLELKRSFLQTSFNSLGRTLLRKRETRNISWLKYSKSTPDSYTETPIRFLVEMKLFRSQYCTKQKIVFLL